MRRLSTKLVCLAGVAAASVLVAACGGSGGQSSQSGSHSGSAESLTVACSTGLQQLPRVLAVDHKLDVKAGVSPKCVQVQSGPGQSAALLSGDLDVAITNPSLLAPLLDKGQNLVVFGTSWNTNFFDIIVRKGYPLPHRAEGWKGVMRDLKGAKFGVVARGAASEIVARNLYTEAGLPADSATYIATGLPTTTVAAMKAGTIDAAVTLEPGVTIAVQQGIATEPFSIQAGTGPKDMQFPDLVFVATRSYATIHKSLLCDFTKAWDAGIQYMTDTANRASVQTTAQTFLGLNTTTTKAMLERDLPFFPKTVAVTPALDASFKFLADHGLAKKAYTTSEIAVNVCS